MSVRARAKLVGERRPHRLSAAERPEKVHDQGHGGAVLITRGGDN
jgi:hypothetical protein